MPLLSLRVTAVVAAATIVEVLLLFALVPALDQRFIFGALNFIIIISALVMVAARIRQQDLKQMEAPARKLAESEEHFRQAEQAFHRRADQQAPLYRISTALARLREPHELCAAVVEVVRDTLGYPCLGIFLLEPTTGDRVLQAHYGWDDAPQDWRLHPGEGVSEKAIRTGELQYWRDVTRELRYVPGLRGAHSELDVPIKTGASVLGVLIVEDTRVDAFGTDDFAVLQAVANQLAVALENARLFEQARRRAEEQITITEMIRALNVALDVHQAFPALVKGLRDLTNAERISLALLDESGQQATFVALDAPQPGPLGQGSRLPVEATSAAADILAGKPHLTPDLRAEIDYPSERALYEAGFRSHVNLPLIVGERVIGVLNLASCQVGTFRLAQIPMLQQIAAAVAISIENTRLFAAEQRARQTAETLRAANLALTQTLNLDTVLETLLDYLARLIPYDGASVLLLEGSSRLVVRAMRGYENWSEREQIRAHAFDAQTHPNLRALVTTQKSALIPDTHAHPDWDRRIVGAERIRNWLGVPLVAGGKVIGLYSLNKNQPGFFTEEHQHLAEALAAQGAVAIQNAWLYEQTRASTARLRTLTQQIVSAQEQERQRLSRELHDEAGQALTALKINLELMRADLPAQASSALHQSIAEAITLTDTTLERMRVLAYNLRPPTLDALGLNATLENLCRQFAQRTRLSVNYTGVPLRSLPEPVDICLYRFVQEALTNVAKHAQAQHVSVTLSHNADGLTLTVADDGRGFERRGGTRGAGPSFGIGLLGLQERLELVGGRMEIDTRPGHGTRLVAYVPVVGGE